MADKIEDGGPAAVKPICVIAMCDRKSRYNNGYCNVHYARWKRYGDPNAGRTIEGSPLKFATHVVSAEKTDDCVIWPYGRASNGYGNLSVGGKTASAHVYVCTLAHGDRPEGHLSAHSCGNGHLGCVNPAHLRWATQSENIREAVTHGTKKVGELCTYAKLTDAEFKEVLSFNGKETKAATALRYGLSASYVAQIHSGRAGRSRRLGEL